MKRDGRRPEDSARYEAVRALDRRAVELLTSGQGYTLESAYRQASAEIDLERVTSKRALTLFR